MTNDPRRRARMRQGFLFLFLALVLGLAIIALPHPSRWLAGHLTAFLTGLILVVISLAWNELRTRQGWSPLTEGLLATCSGRSPISPAQPIDDERKVRKERKESE